MSATSLSSQAIATSKRARGRLRLDGNDGLCLHRVYIHHLQQGRPRYLPSPTHADIIGPCNQRKTAAPSSRRSLYVIPLPPVPPHLKISCWPSGIWIEGGYTLPPLACWIFFISYSHPVLVILHINKKNTTRFLAHIIVSWDLDCCIVFGNILKCLDGVLANLMFAPPAAHPSQR